MNSNLFCFIFIETNEEKTIYRQSTKQMLISSPPAILILHLKRFQMCYSTTRKMTRDVSFPWVLDIAPYCSVKCQVSNNTYYIFLNTSQTLIFILFVYLFN